MTSTGESSNLDFLRSVAIGAVLFDHCSRVLGNNGFGAIGRAGVLLFFVHTALVLMFSLERLSRSRGDLVVPFYIQRIFRIYPLCWVCIAAVLIFQIPAGGHYQWLGWGAITRNLLLVQNFTFTPFVSGPLWSLPYEVQMYLALPFIFALTRKRLALVYIALLWLASAASAVLLNRFYIAHYGEHYDDSLHSPLTWFVPCFLGGVVAYILSKKSRPVLPFVVLPASLLAFLALIFYTPFKHQDWIGCTVLGALLPYISELQNRAARVTCHRLAKYSYGIYLSHAPLIWVYFHRIPQLDPAIRWLLFWVSVAVISTASYWLIEKPLINVGRGLARRLATHGRREQADDAGSSERGFEVMPVATKST